LHNNFYFPKPFSTFSKSGWLQSSGVFLANSNITQLHPQQLRYR